MSNFEDAAFGAGHDHNIRSAYIHVMADAAVSVPAIIDVWRLGPGHMSAVVSVATNEAQRSPTFYHAALKRFKGLSHVTVEVNPIRTAA